MRKANILWMIALLCGPMSGTAAAPGPERDATDTRGGVLRAVDEVYRPSSLFRAFAYGNPALKRFQYDTKLSELSIGVHLRDEQAALMRQYGDRAQFYALDAVSFLPLSPHSTVWGGAGYRNGSKKNVLWNSTSDYEILYPYVTADSVGGGMDQERYRFNGGYGRSWGKWTLGLAGDFRAQQEYRQINPRPLDRTLDVKVSAGAGYSIGDRYAVALAATGRIYNQSSEVKTFSDADNVNVARQFLMEGLGSYNAGFTGQYVRYRGYASGASIDVCPLGGSGIYARLAYDRFDFERLSDTSFPINRLIDHLASAEVAWLRQARWTLGLKGRLEYRYKEGIDNIASKVPGKDDVLLGLTMFEYRSTDVYAGAIVGRQGRVMEWFAEPYVSFYALDEQHIYPVHTMESDHVRSGIKLSAAGQWAKWRVACSAQGAYCDNGKGALRLPVANMRPFMVDMVRYAYGRLSTDYALAGLDVRIDRQLNDHVGVCLGAQWRRFAFSDDTHSDTLTVNVGMTF